MGGRVARRNRVETGGKEYPRPWLTAQQTLCRIRASGTRLPAALGLRAPSGPFRAGPSRCRNIRRFRRNTITIIKEKKKRKFTGANLNRRHRLSGAAGPRLWGPRDPSLPDQRRSSRPSGLPGAQQSAPPPRPDWSCSIPGCRDPRLPTLRAGHAAAHLPTSPGAALLHAAKAPRPTAAGLPGLQWGGWAGPAAACRVGAFSHLSLYTLAAPVMLEGSFITSVKTNQRAGAWPAGREGAVAWPGQDAERWRRRNGSRVLKR